MAWHTALIFRQTNRLRRWVYCFPYLSFLFLCEVIFNIKRLPDFFWGFTFNHICNCFTGDIQQSFDVQIICSLKKAGKMQVRERVKQEPIIKSSWIMELTLNNAISNHPCIPHQDVLNKIGYCLQNFLAVYNNHGNKTNKICTFSKTQANRKIEPCSPHLSLYHQHSLLCLKKIILYELYCIYYGNPKQQKLFRDIIPHYPSSC